MTVEHPVIYLAQPIDQMEAPHIALGTTLVEMGCTVFDPFLAFSGVDGQAAIQEINTIAIKSCDGMLAYLPDGQPSIGVPVEMARAVDDGMPVVVVGGSVVAHSSVIAHLGVPVYHETNVPMAVTALRQIISGGLGEIVAIPETPYRERKIMTVGGSLMPVEPAQWPIEDFLNAVACEIDRAETLHPETEANTLDDWYGIWMEEVVEAAQAWNDWRKNRNGQKDLTDTMEMRSAVTNELVQVGAMAARLWDSLR